MVAITVVLAAVLYIMVIGLAPTTTTTKPSGAWGPVVPESNSTAKATFGGFSADPAPVNLKIKLQKTATDAGTYSFPGNGDQTTLKLDSGSPQGTIVYFDNIDNSRANQGDYLMMSGLTPNTQYSIMLLWSDGSQLDLETFSTPS